MKKGKVLIVILVIVLIVLIAAGMYLVEKYKPTTEQEDLLTYFGLSEADDVAVVRDDELQSYYGKDMGGAVYLPFDIVEETLNDRFYVDPEGMVLYTASTREIFATPGDAGNTYHEKIYADGTVTEDDVTLPAPAVGLYDGALYLSLDFVQQFTPFDYAYYQDPARVILTTEYGEEKTVEVLKDTALRVKGGIKSPVLKNLTAGEVVRVLDEEENWYKVASEDGFIGYVEKKRVGEVTSTVQTSAFTEEPYTHKLLDGTVSMVWHQVTNQEGNEAVSEVLAASPGIDVISPTWFYLNDTAGAVADIASASYVDYCHANGVQVWGLVSNLENKDIDDESMLYAYTTRQLFISTMIEKAKTYGMDGINLDFETISEQAGEAYVQLISELGLECKNQGIILSVDNHVPADYSYYYKRGQQSLFADYIIIMGYDEHYNGSDEGSVASLPWVTAGIEDTIAEGVPAEQIILGMPFYTRVWEETPKSEVVSDMEMASDDYVPYELSSRAISMNEQNRLAAVSENGITWLDDMGQNYTEWTEDGKTYKMWMEDSASLERKLMAMKDHNLAGGCFWKTGMEDPAVWDVIVQYLN